VAQAVFGRQLSRQRRDNFLTVLRARLAEDIAPDAVPNPPIEQHELGIYGLRDAEAGRFNEPANVGRQLSESVRGPRGRFGILLGRLLLLAQWH
jgi:hypothetical protein